MIKDPDTKGISVYWRATVIASIMLLSSTIILTAVAMNAPVWFTFELAEQGYEFGLFYCSTCPDRHSNYSTDCFKTFDCKTRPESNLCILGKQTYEASISYFWISLVSLLCCLLLCERILYMLFGRDYGHAKVLYILAISVVVLQSVSTIVWFGRSKAKFSGSCSVAFNEEIKICASSGSVLAICSSILGAVASGVTILAIVNRDRSFDTGVVGIASGSIIGIPHRKWLMLKISPFLVAGFALQLMATCWHWTNYKSSEEHKGYLLYIDQYLDFDRLGYNCLFGPACATSMDFHIEKRHCSAFKRAWEAGSTFLYIDAASLFMSLLWIEGFAYFLNKREFGVPLLQYAWPVLATLLHFAALLAWLIKSGARFGNSCDVDPSDDDIEFCSDKSTSFAIWSTICYFFTSAFYILIYYNRRDFSELASVVSDSGMFNVKNPEMPDTIIASEWESDSSSIIDSSPDLRTKRAAVWPLSSTEQRKVSLDFEEAQLSRRNEP